VPKEFKEQRWGPNSPVGWIFAVILLWIVYFPLYLAQRPHYLENRRKPNQCPFCKKYYEGIVTFCPNCGKELI
jgi:hypothetical protein